ncbi:Bug family tripartite tricarboxylate transporter substrate binding protein [Salipiger bermudensis]|uniref:Bug family tripartite tricarboxylate transporter substrate binding protein n=1 Tax=Salipiger TaxID=263377 RepID=UPI001CD2E868|nr:tripartite tricarboxylate transporter substrate-binding protein [Salipiger bermudensis]MCA0964645.1 tripartite tricarboxylate transporter substrate binding protein [Salipiger bermudensis]
MKFTRFGAAIIVAAGFAASASAQVQIDNPECVAPANPGGGFDLTCRVAQTGLDPHIDAPVQVTFMPGGIGAVAYNLFNSTRTDDGSAIVAFSTGSLLNIVTGKYGAFTEKDVRWVGTAGADFGAVVVRADSDYTDLSQLMSDFSADPASVVVGAGGSVGSQDWMKGALLLREAGAKPMDMRYVAFDGGGDAIAALLGGSIEVYMGDVGEMVPHIESGQMRILAVMSPDRLEAPFAEIPTAIEQGFDVEWTILRGFYMGGEVSDEDYQKWVDAFEAAYATPEFAAIQKERGLLPMNLAGEALQSSIEERVENLRTIAKEAGLIN